MLPYPSGVLHMGHVRNYSIGDALARYMWMNGYNVLIPWAGFLRVARGKRRYPEQHSAAPVTLGNIAKMKAQMKRLGFAYGLVARSHHLSADYYRWKSVVLPQVLRKGFGLSQEQPSQLVSQVRHVLANEQVVDGRCWRHEDILVEQRELEQWVSTHHEIRR